MKTLKLAIALLLLNACQSAMAKPPLCATIEFIELQTYPIQDLRELMNKYMDAGVRTSNDNEGFAEGMNCLAEARRIQRVMLAKIAEQEAKKPVQVPKQ